MSKYIPHRGDFIMINFQPRQGRELTKRRPALVISASAYNQKVGLAICCPVTSHQKGYPFEVELSEELPLNGVILADQIKCLDWQKRKAEFISKATEDILEEVIEKLHALLFSN